MQLRGQQMSVYAFSYRESFDHLVAAVTCDEDTLRTSMLWQADIELGLIVWTLLELQTPCDGSEAKLLSLLQP